MTDYRVPHLDTHSWQEPVKDRITAATQGGLSPAKGDRYIITDAANANKIAYYTGSGWLYATPVEGFKLWVDDEDLYYRFDGSNWATIDVSSSAVITDHTIVRGDGGVKGVQDTGITVDDSDNIVGGSYDGALEGKSIDIVSRYNEGIADNDSLSLIFDFVPSKIVLEYVGLGNYSGEATTTGSGKGMAVITITGTDTFTSVMYTCGAYWNEQTDKAFNMQNYNDTSNICNFPCGVNASGATASMSATGGWVTATKVFALTFQETAVDTSTNVVSVVATAYK